MPKQVAVALMAVCLLAGIAVGQVGASLAPGVRAQTAPTYEYTYVTDANFGYAWAKFEAKRKEDASWELQDWRYSQLFNAPNSSLYPSVEWVIVLRKPRP